MLTQLYTFIHVIIDLCFSFVIRRMIRAREISGFFLYTRIKLIQGILFKSSSLGSRTVFYLTGQLSPPNGHTSLNHRQTVSVESKYIFFFYCVYISLLSLFFFVHFYFFDYKLTGETIAKYFLLGASYCCPH